MYQEKSQNIKNWIIGSVFLFFVIWLFSALNNILSPFIGAAVLAYILNPLVVKLSNKGIKRGLASMLVMIFALLILLILFIIIVPMIIRQFNSIVIKLPILVTYVQTNLLPWLHRIFGENITIDTATILAWLQSHSGSITNTLQKITPSLVKQGSNIVVIFTNLFLLPFLLYYFLLDWKRWSEGLAKMVPRRYIGTYTRITGNINKVLGEFLRGQLTVMLIMGLIYGIGLMLVGLDSGFAIGMIAGILVFVPYLGSFTGLLLATIAATLQFGDWQGVIIVWAVFGLGQLIESFIVTPKIVGDRIGLSPFWVIFSLLAFGQLLGFVGMLVGLPLAAVTQVLLKEGVALYFNSRIYKKLK